MVFKLWNSSASTVAVVKFESEGYYYESHVKCCCCCCCKNATTQIKAAASRDAVIEIIKSINYHLISNCENVVIH